MKALRAYWGGLEGAAKEEFLASRAGVPTLLHHVDPKVGLRNRDLMTAAIWADHEVGPVADGDEP